MFSDSNTFHEVVQATLAGDDQAGVVLASGLTNLLSSAFPQLYIGQPKRFIEGDPTKLRWYGPFNDEVIRFGIVEDGEVVFAVFNFEKMDWERWKYHSLCEFITMLFMVESETDPDSIPPSEPPIDPRRSRPSDGLN